MTTPDTPEQDELLEQLTEAAMMWEGRLEAPADFPGSLDDALAPIVAKIRRQAAADALNEQAAAFDRQAAFFVKQQNALLAKGDQASADVYTSYVDQNHRAATKLRAAALDKLAEGYAYTCPWTAPANRENPSDYCENRVEHEGDHCPQHETEDDDRWAE